MKNMKLINKTIAVCAVLFLSACAPRQPLLVNDVYLTIENPVTIFPGSAYSYIQNGASMPKQSLNRYKPFCSISTNVLAKGGPLQILPQTVKISGIYSDFQNFGDYYYKGIKKHRVRLDDINGPYLLRSNFNIATPNNQQLMRLSCIRRVSDGFALHLDIDDVNVILGNNASVYRQ